MVSLIFIWTLTVDSLKRLLWAVLVDAILTISLRGGEGLWSLGDGIGVGVGDGAGSPNMAFDSLVY